MPVMNGIEMIRKAKEQYPDMTFVVLSGYGDYEFTSQAMELGVRHYILKPCDEAKMIPVLNKAISELEETRAQNAALPETVNEIFDIRALRQAGSYEELLRELALAFARMEAKNYRPRQQAQLCELAWKLLFEERPRRRMRCRLGRMPLHLANARPFGRSKAPLGLLLLRKRELALAGGTGPSRRQQRETERSRRGTPCCTYRYRTWIFQGASGWAHPVFMETHAVPYATSGSFLRTPSAVVSYKTRPENLARTS